MSHLLKKWLWSLLRIVEMINLHSWSLLFRAYSHSQNRNLNICERTQTYASTTKTTLAHKPISEIISSCGHNPNWKRKRNSDSFSIYGFNVIPKSRNKKIRVYLHILSIWMRVLQHLTEIDITQAAQASICWVGSESISSVIQPNCKKKRPFILIAFSWAFLKSFKWHWRRLFFHQIFKATRRHYPQKAEVSACGSRL